MATDIEANTDAAAEAKAELISEPKLEAKTELPLVSPIDIPAAADPAPAAGMAAATAAPSIEAAKPTAPKPSIAKPATARPARPDFRDAEPQRPDFGDQTLRLAIEMAAARSADETRKRFFNMPVPASAVAKPPTWRTPLAAAVVLAAVGGAAFGSLSGASLGYLWFGSSGSNKIEANALSTMKAELAELATLKASVDGATRGANGQFAKLADRLDRVEHAQAEPSAKLTHISEALDRLEKKSAASAAPLAAPETTGSISAPPANADATKTDKLLQDWIVQDARHGHALVASRFGGVFDVAVGSMLPGLGHVQAIKRQDGQWVVLTDKGLISER
ncbi:MAG TPA: hypothetical protein VGG11_12595 [Xanthobacteraceae bacterium]|jgi:hypothetical protein